ncbi:hypothetical protein PM3016_4018 [Paenibacillus mucilaginosus 3016]|uniref:Uncharacterized protein n=1 Tax=Paenibacillus mucilaginosus 3016 TaxID=1116391 RepID=H6NI31_9BACL|nr:hypothetical protein PM3016_4018 [Paenibacillus mucilaginosus 3016]
MTFRIDFSHSGGGRAVRSGTLIFDRLRAPLSPTVLPRSHPTWGFVPIPLLSQTQKCRPIGGIPCNAYMVSKQ